MASATGNAQESIGLDAFPLPLPKTCQDCHAFCKGNMKRPLLSVGKVCDVSCRVSFKKCGCLIKDAKSCTALLCNVCDKRAGLCLLSRHLDCLDIGLPTSAPPANYDDSSVPHKKFYWVQSSGHQDTAWPGLSITSGAQCTQREVHPAINPALPCLCGVPRHFDMDKGCQPRLLHQLVRLDSLKGETAPPNKSRRDNSRPHATDTTGHPQHQLQGCSGRPSGHHLHGRPRIHHLQG